MKEGKLYIVSAPSGAGKTSLIAALRKQLPDLELSISHTTRAPREGEQHGQHYHFIDEKGFLQQVEQGQFLEYAQVFDNYYGTSINSIEESTRQGRDVILEIDWQGARQVREKYPQAVSIFILPPSLDELRERLTARAKDEPAVIEKRVAKARDEIAHYKDYDYIVINDEFNVALEQLTSIFLTNRLRTHWVMHEHSALINDLLSI